MVLSSKEVQQFLFEVVQKTSFPGQMAEFVAFVKREISDATISQEEKIPTE